MHLAIEEIERRFQEVMHRHSPRKHLHIHVIASRVRLEMKGAFTDVKERIKVRVWNVTLPYRCCYSGLQRGGEGGGRQKPLLGLDVNQRMSIGGDVPEHVENSLPVNLASLTSDGAGGMGYIGDGPLVELSMDEIVLVRV